MATTEQLKVKITADASQAKAEIGKFKDSLKETSSATDAATAAVGKLKGAMVALVAVKAAKAIKDMALDVASMGDEIKDNAQKVFMGTTAYQEWGYVLKQNGLEMNVLKTAMRQFAPQVAAGSDALRKYGITATDVDTAFEEAIYTIQNMATETERITAATELFGSRALELMPVLNMTNGETQNLMATYRALGATMSNELIAASDTCSDSITAMKAAWGGLRNVLAAYVIPIITKVVQWVTIAIAYVRILLSAILGIKSTFGGTNKKTSLPATTGAVATNTGNTAKNLGKAAKHAKELKRTLMGIDELTKLVEQATAQAASSPSGGGVGGGDVGGGVGDMGEFDDIISDETLDKIEKFRQKVESIQGILNGCYLILKGLIELSFGNFKQAWADIKEGITKVWDNLKELFPGLQKIEDFAKTLKSKWDDFKKSAKEKITTSLNDYIGPKIKTLKDKWKAFRSYVKERILVRLKDKITSKIKDLKNKWSAFKGKVKNYSITITIKTVGKNILDKIYNVWTAVKDKVVTLKIQFIESMKSVWNSLAQKVNNARANSVLARTLIPSDLPYLAKGGVLTTPTTAVMGEYPGARYNPEIATPQSLMYETIKDANGDLVTAFAQMTRQVIAAIESKDMTVNIGDEQVARSAQRGNTAYKQRTGKALLTV